VKLPIELVVFDIAGTLIEDHNEVADAFLQALGNNQIEAASEEVNELKGSSKRQVIAHFVERQFGRCRNLPLIERTYAEFRFRLEQTYTPDRIIPIAGAIEILKELKDRKLKLATTTGFYREVRDKIIDSLHWRDLFDAHVCSDDVAQGRPAPDMIQRAMQLSGLSDSKNVANVGDTPLDLQAGNAAGCSIVIGVLTGVHTHERLQREPHTYLLDSIAELPKVLLRS
jgi:phosphonatase-like hydrolase